MDELQAGIEQPLTVLPPPPVLLQPGKAALDDPALGHHFECVQLAALGDLHRDMLTQDVTHALREGRSHITGVCQQALYPRQRGLAALERLQRPLSVRHLGRRHRHGMGKSLGVHRNVALDPADLLARVIALARRRVRVLHALRVDDQDRAAGVAPQSRAGHANLIFLKPAPAR